MKKDTSEVIFSDEKNPAPSRRMALRSLSLAAAALGLAIGAQPGSAATKKIKINKNSSQGHAKSTHGAAPNAKTGSKSSDDFHLKRSKN
jgi:hypothetical protein